MISDWKVIELSQLPTLLKETVALKVVFDTEKHD